MEALILIVALITLLVALAVLCLVAYPLYQQSELATYEIPSKPVKKAKDAYTPDYADQTTPLEDFEPDFSRPIKVKNLTGSKRKDFVVEGEQLTPIATDDLQEEDESQR